MEEGSRRDPTTDCTCILPSGRTITLFFYDGPISQGIAFEGLLKSGEILADRLVSAFDDLRPLGPVGILPLRRRYRRSQGGLSEDRVFLEERIGLHRPVPLLRVEMVC
jgi:hypothetical protein